MSRPTLPPPGVVDALALGPELILCGTIVLLLVGRCVTPRFGRWAGPVVCLASLAGVAICSMQLVQSLDGVRLARGLPHPFVRFGPLFGGLLEQTALTATIRLLVLLTLGLVAVLCGVTGLPRPRQAIDFWTLLLGATIGALFTASANHALMLFVGVEMMSVPGYALAAYFKGRGDATEASLKYVVYGAGASGAMLYGLSLLVALTGEVTLPSLLPAASAMLRPDALLDSPQTLLALAAVLMVVCGLAFKLSAAPFHFWCPDVFTGAPAEVAGFLSVAPKIATVGLLARIVLMSPPELSQVLGFTFSLLSILSVVLGNLAAYRQENAKRLMAYSTIAHAGYLLLGLAAIAMVSPDRRPDAVTSTLYYAFAYVFMNLTIFAGIAILRGAVGGETLSHYRRLTKRSGAATVTIGAVAASCFSLVGLPPFAGFFGKLRVFASAFLAALDDPLIGAALLASVVMSIVSLGYYLKLLAPMVFGEPDSEQRRIRVSAESAFFVATLAAVLLLLLIPMAGPLLELCERVASSSA